MPQLPHARFIFLIFKFIITVSFDLFFCLLCSFYFQILGKGEHHRVFGVPQSWPNARKQIFKILNSLTQYLNIIGSLVSQDWPNGVQALLGIWVRPLLFFCTFYRPPWPLLTRKLPTHPRLRLQRKGHSLSTTRSQDSPNWDKKVAGNVGNAFKLGNLQTQCLSSRSRLTKRQAFPITR